MPPKITPSVSAGGYGYQNVFDGPADHTQTVKVDVTALTDDEVDADGYIKPGVPLSAAGGLVGAAVAVRGVVLEPIKVADSNGAADLAAASTAFWLAVPTIGQVRQDAIEYNLGRALTADEIAGFGLAGCRIVLEPST
jgi:hypothetical protein